MTPDDMLAWLHEAGLSAKSDFNDNEDILGWFGWEVHDGVLTVTYEQSEGDCDEFAASWVLVPTEMP